MDKKIREDLLHYLEKDRRAMIKLIIQYEDERRDAERKIEQVKKQLKVILDLINIIKELP